MQCGWTTSSTLVPEEVKSLFTKSINKGLFFLDYLDFSNNCFCLASRKKSKTIKKASGLKPERLIASGATPDAYQLKKAVAINSRFMPATA